MIRRGYSPMFRRFYIPKVLCSEGSIFRRFYIPKVLYSEGSMLRKTERFYILKVLCSEISDFVAYHHLMRLWMTWTRSSGCGWVSESKKKKSGNVEITARGD